MKKEDKKILLRDLCARLPYGVKCQHFDDKTPYALLGIDEDVLHIDCPVYDEGDGYVEIEYCKPYLRSLSSMTEEEKRELSKKYVWDISCGQIKIRYHSEGYWDNNTKCPTSEYLKLFDWLNMHHFDYHGLIEKGLALEATRDMYNL